MTGRTRLNLNFNNSISSLLGQALLSASYSQNINYFSGLAGALQSNLLFPGYFLGIAIKIVRLLQAEAPVVEAPKIETPVAPPPAVETPKIETPIASPPIVESPRDETPIEETPIEETPGGDDPVTEATIAEEDKLIYGNGNLLTLVGGAGSDRLYGSDRAETFESGAGDDKIYSNGGADYIDSGSGMDEVWLGGASDATVILSTGQGYDFIANYQVGSTTLKGFAESELTLKNGDQGAEIFKGDDKLAVVGWKTTGDLSGAFIV